jgi:hypothetical protein
MYPLLESAWIKLQRADSHLERLKAQVEAFLERQRHVVLPHLDRKSGEIVFWVHRPLEEPPSEMYPVIGDALFNYRSALDHLMWALVIQSGGQPQPGATQFPIYDTREAFFHERRGGRRWAGVSTRIRAVLEREQPYYGGDSVKSGLLRLLDGLHNVDKHRHFSLTTGAFAGFFEPAGDIRIEALRSINQSAIFSHGGGRVKQGTVLARIPRQYVNVEFNPAFDVIFDETTEAPNQKVLLVLGGIADVVHDILDQYERLFFYDDSTALGRHWDELHDLWDSTAKG